MVSSSARSCGRQLQIDVLERRARRPRASSSSSAALSAQPDSSCRSAATLTLGSTQPPARAQAGALGEPGGQVARLQLGREREGDLRVGHLIAPAERLRRALGDDLPGGDDRDPVGQAFGLLHVVGGEEDGLAEFRCSPPITSQAARRADGSKPVVGSSRKISSGSPISASATSSRRALAARQPVPRVAGLLAETDERDRLVDRHAARGSSRRTAPGTRARSAPARAPTPAAPTPIRARQAACALPGSSPSTRTSPSSAWRKPSRISTVGRLARSVGPEEGEDLPALDLEVDAPDGLGARRSACAGPDRDDRVGAGVLGGSGAALASPQRRSRVREHVRPRRRAGVIGARVELGVVAAPEIRPPGGGDRPRRTDGPPCGGPARCARSIAARVVATYNGLDMDHEHPRPAPVEAVVLRPFGLTFLAVFIATSIATKPAPG